MHKLTIEIVKERLKNINPSIYILSDEYKNAKSKLKLMCKICKHTWESKWSNLSQGKGCPICGVKNSSLKRTFTLENIKEKLKIINPNINISSDRYINSGSKLSCSCKVCGNNWDATWDSLLQNHGCPKCAITKTTSRNKFDLEKVKEKVKAINPTINILSKEYINNNSQLKCHCSVCNHKWQTTYGSLSQGHGCPDCAKKSVALKQTLSFESIKIKLRKINPNIEIISNQYVKQRLKVKCKCLIDGHIWESKTENLLQGYGCPKCKSSKGEKQIAEWLGKNNINYFPQYRFSNCRDKNPLPFDFYIPDMNICIEYDGELHFKPFRKMEESLDKLRKTQFHDNIKNQYCKQKGIKLIRIPYWEKDSIINILDNLIQIK